MRAFDKLTKAGRVGADLHRQFADNELIDNYVAGYNSVRPWPLNDRPLEQALAAARRLTFINLALDLRRPGWPEYIDPHAAPVVEWMAGLAQPATVI